MTAARYGKLLNYTEDGVNTVYSLFAHSTKTSSAMDGTNGALAPSIDVKNLSYLFPDGSSGLKDVILDLPPGSRTLLIGGK